MELWLPIPGWEGWYEASNEGRIRSLDRIVLVERKHPLDLIGAYEERHYTGKILKPGVNKKSGTLYVNLARGGPTVCRTVASLVLETFVGPRPPGTEACHWDDDQTNNKLTNLRWDTRLANARDAIRNGRRNGPVRQ